ncbi:MAG TPA: hypothetical protein VMZ30_06350, partial [Pyrinomonadaceae bacterium]|nr:hypothetical protein [Pyrinomonadaceae bacterium]
MKRILAAIAITSFLSSAAFAGDIPSVPGPQSPAGLASAPTPGQIPYDGIAEQLSDESLSTLLSAL